MKKLLKLVSILLCLMLSFSFVACGEDDDNGDSGNTAKGQQISAEQADEFLVQLETYLDEIENSDELPFDKFTYTTKITMDNTVMVANSKYSKQDSYFYEYGNIADQQIYDYSESEKVLISTVHSTINYTWTYIDADGKLLRATDRYNDITDYYDGQSDRGQTQSKNYRYLDENPSTAVASFNDDDIVESAAIFLEFINQMESMISTLSPLLALGSISYGGTSIETRSLGVGHLYMKISMMGMLYECEINDNVMTYYKIDMDMSKLPTGDIGLDYQRMTTEYVFQKDVCEISYPDLTSFELQN